MYLKIWAMSGCTRSSDRVRIATCPSLVSDSASVGLHPVFGPGEDRNLDYTAAARPWDGGCTRSSDRVRIATASPREVETTLPRAAPGLRTG